MHTRRREREGVRCGVKGFFMQCNLRLLCAAVNTSLCTRTSCAGPAMRGCRASESCARRAAASRCGSAAAGSSRRSRAWRSRRGRRDTARSRSAAAGCGRRTRTARCAAHAQRRSAAGCGGRTCTRRRRRRRLGTAHIAASSAASRRRHQRSGAKELPETRCVSRDRPRHREGRRRREHVAFVPPFVQSVRSADRVVRRSPGPFSSARACRHNPGLPCRLV